MLFDCPSSSPKHFVIQCFLFRRRKRLRRQTFRQKIMSLIMSAEQPQAISSNKQSDFSHYAIPRVISYQWFLSREAYINTRSIVDHISIRKKWLISRGISHKTLWELIPKKGSLWIMRPEKNNIGRQVTDTKKGCIWIMWVSGCNADTRRDNMCGQISIQG